jgi:hypothetical protein
MTGSAERGRADLVVWSGWAVLVTVAMRHASRMLDVPVLDEWRLVAVLAGRRAFGLSWLWARDAEHRLPLPLFLQYALHRATGDFRAAIWFDLALYAGLAAVLLAAVRRLRGRATFSDLVFPLALLHPGLLSLRSGYEMVFVLPTVLTCGAVLAATRLGDSARAATTIGICALLLPLCGVQGFLLSVPLAIALVLHAVRIGRAGGASLGARAIPIGLATATLVVGGLVWIGWRPVREFPGPAGVLPSLRTALQFTGSAIGPADRALFPVPGLVLAALLATLVVLLWRRRRDPSDGPAAIAIAFALAGFAALALAVGIGRSGFGTWAGHAPQYPTLAAMLPCLLGVAWTRFGPPRVESYARAVLFAVVCAGTAFDVRLGADQTRAFVEEATALERDAWLGVRDRRPELQALPRNLVRSKVRRRYLEVFAMAREARLPPFDRSDAERDRLLAPFYRSLSMLRTTPDRIRSVHPVRAVACGGTSALSLHPPAEIRFRVAAGDWRLSGRVGLCPDEHVLVPTSDGVRFRVTLRTTGRSSVVAERAVAATDPPLVPIDVVVHSPEAAHVVVETDVGPAGDARGDAAAVTELRVAPAGTAP